MTANQRRPGFRLPWSSETDASAGDDELEAPPARPNVEKTTVNATPAVESKSAEPMKFAPAARREAAASESVADADATGRPGAPTPKADVTDAAQPEGTKADATDATPDRATEPDAATTGATAPDAAGGEDFMRDLVAAMRRVADEARKSGVDELRSRADEQVRGLEAEAERRREDLRARAEADVTGVGEWANAEAERIKVEAETRVVARRAQLEQQLAADTTRTEADKKALRDRVAEYERELDAFHAQLAEINDAAAFAAAAKRMPHPPQLAAQASAPAPATETEAVPPTPAASGDDVPVEPATGASNGVPGMRPAVHPAEEEVLAARLAELDATLPDAAAAAAAAESAGPVTTEIVVKGLGSFGAITGFRQALSGVAGIEGVALSLGQSGEFVFRTTHVAGFDVRSAITSLEGDGAKMEDDEKGGLRVTLDRAR